MRRAPQALRFIYQNCSGAPTGPPASPTTVSVTYDMLVPSTFPQSGQAIMGQFHGRPVRCLPWALPRRLLHGTSSGPSRPALLGPPAAHVDGPPAASLPLPDATQDPHIFQSPDGTVSFLSTEQAYAKCTNGVLPLPSCLPWRPLASLGIALPSPVLRCRPCPSMERPLPRPAGIQAPGVVRAATWGW